MIKGILKCYKYMRLYYILGWKYSYDCFINIKILNGMNN